MRLKIILLGCFLYSTILWSQNPDAIIQQLEKQADSIYLNQNQYYSSSEFKKGISIYDDALKRINDKQNERYKKILAKKLATKAAYYEYTHNTDSAIVYSKKSITLQEQFKHPNKLFLGLTHKRLYQQWYTLNEYDSTIVAARLAKQIFADTLGDNHELIAEAIFNIGGAYARKGERDKNIEYYKKAIAMNIAANGEFTPEAAYQEHHLALTYGFIGFYKKELESYKKVVRRWEAIPDYKDMSYLSVAYGALSTWYLQHGDLKTAEQYLLKQEALIKSRKQDLKHWYNETFKGRTQTRIWYNKANLALYKQDTLNAIAFNDKALNFIANFDRNDPKNNPHNLSYSNNFVDLQHMKSLRLKANMFKTSRPEQANAINEKILKLERKGEVPTVTLQEKLNILDFHLASKNVSKAKTKMTHYLAQAKIAKSDYVLMHLYAKKAKIALLQESYEQMDGFYKTVFNKLQRDSLQAIPIQKLKPNDCKPYGDGRIVNMILDATKNYSKAYESTSKSDYLGKAYNLSVLASSIFSENYSYSPFNDAKYNKANQINEQLLNMALLFKDNLAVDEVLQSIELNGSKLSWKKFLASNQRENLNISDSIIEKENDLKSQLHFYKKQLFVNNESDQDKVKLFREKLYDVETEIERLEEWYQTNYPGYFSQTQKPFDVTELKQKLRKKQQVIKYVFAEDNVYAFSIAKDSISLLKLASKKEILDKLKPFVRTLNKLNSDNYKTLAKEVYTLLLPPPLLNTAKKQSLIFVQDDVLSYVPMEVLLDAEGKYLIESHAVSYAPSLLLWNEQLKVKKSKRNKMGVFVPSYKKQKGNNPKRDDDSDLLGANTEAITISKLFNSDVFSGNEVSKAQFLSTAKNYNILHLAMHSAINETDAEFSNLRFSSDDDGKLFISELYNMNLNADLAVLSACNTGSGSLKNGEGLINVSRAFTYAGVPSTVTSLWKVPDQETSQIMISFYKYLKEGKTKNSALQLAKLEYLEITKDVELRHPYYWAGFVISGDIEPISSGSNMWLYILLAVTLLVILFRKKLLQFFS